MTPPHSHDLFRRSRPALTRAALWLAMAALALCASGCWASLIPLALDGVGAVGKLIGEGAEAGTMVKHGNDQDPEETEVMDQTKFDDSDFDSASSKNTANAARCNELELITPAIIEFRTDRNGTTQWRELGLGGTQDAPRWTVVTQTADAGDAAGAATKVRDIAPGGWAPANNLDHMQFAPPLKTSSDPGAGFFMAYAPASPLAGVERDELASLTLDFGPIVGTFKFNDRAFQYSTLQKLPCFPVPD